MQLNKGRHLAHTKKIIAPPLCPGLCRSPLPLYFQIFSAVMIQRQLYSINKKEKYFYSLIISPLPRTKVHKM